jgi:hypothetical protein
MSSGVNMMAEPYAQIANGMGNASMKAKEEVRWTNG